MAPEVRLIAASADLVDGGAGARFELDGPDGPVPAFAIRWRGCVRAYVNSCPHQGSELDWLPGEFFDAGSEHLICATHGALFEPDTGRCVKGPCKGRALTSVRVEVTEEAVLLLP